MKDSNEAAAKLTQVGAIGVIATDTVYGVVARAQDQAAVKRLYELKKRDKKPGTIIAASIEQLEELGLKRRYLTAVDKYWPGQVSVIIPCANPALSYLHQGKMSLAVRIPEGSALPGLLKETGPLLTSSANYSGEPTVNTIGQAKQTFGDEVDFYIDGGDLSDHQASTIIRIVDDAIEVVRQGAVIIDEERD